MDSGPDGYREIERDFAANPSDNNLASKLEVAIARSGEKIAKHLLEKERALSFYSKQMIIAYANRILPKYPELHFGHTDKRWESEICPPDTPLGSTQLHPAILILRNGTDWMDANFPSNSSLYFLPNLGLRRFPRLLYTDDIYPEPQMRPSFDKGHENLLDYLTYRNEVIIEIENCVNNYPNKGQYRPEAYRQTLPVEEE